MSEAPPASLTEPAALAKLSPPYARHAIGDRMHRSDRRIRVRLRTGPNPLQVRAYSTSAARGDPDTRASRVGSSRRCDSSHTAVAEESDIN